MAVKSEREPEVGAYLRGTELKFHGVDVESLPRPLVLYEEKANEKFFLCGFIGLYGHFLPFSSEN